MRRIRLFAVLVACVAALAAASPASAAEGQIFGFNENSVGSTPVTAETAGGLAKQAGAKSVTVGVDWRSVEPWPGVYRWGFYDQLYNSYRAQGIKPVFLLLYAPFWTWAPGQTCQPNPLACRYPPSPAHDGAFAEFARRAAQRYPDLAALQIWNEPNISHTWAGGLNPERYTAMLKAAYPAIKSANPSVPVLGGALANISGPDTASGIADRRFLARMYAAGAKGHMDGIAVHPYPYDIDLWAFFKGLNDVRSVRDAAGDSGTELWITEVGVSTTDRENRNWWFNDNDQAAILTRIQRILKRMPDVGARFVHTLIEPSYWPETDKERGYGVVKAEPGLQPKPAFCALAKMNGTGYTCPQGIPSDPGPQDPGQVRRWDAQELVQAAADAARAFRADHGGSYYGLTPAQLHAIDSRLSDQPANLIGLAGPAEDPSRIGVWVWEAAGEQLLLCNLSKADRSYCIWAKPDGSWVYGMAQSSIMAAAAYTLAGFVAYW